MQQQNKQQVSRISFSELKNWKECPYRHKLVYIDKLPYFEGNEYTAFGTAIHSVCEEVILDNSKDALKIFLKNFDKEINTLKEAGLSINKSLISEMKEQATPICKQAIPAIKNYFKNFKVISVEELLLEPIKEFDSFGKNFKGFIDLVLQTEDGNYHIIDWKTCSWGWNAQRKSDPMTNYQLVYYKNYFSKKHNIDPTKINTYFALLKRTAKKENVEMVRVTSGTKKIQNSLKVLQNAVINIENKNFVKNRLNCKYCKFKNTEYCK